MSGERGAGLSESQINCLCAVWLGSKGAGSNARTLDSLLRRGLVTVRQHQGAPLWETTDRGSDLAANTLCPEDDVHDPRCYQTTGGIPDGLPADLCDCRTWRMLDAATGSRR